MRFSSVFATAAAVFVSVASALENPISEPTASSKLVAGQMFNITWAPSTKGSITLLLKKGLSTNLATVGSIAKDISNSGSYPWLIPANLESGADYAIEIDSAANDVNYTPQFSISGVAPSSTSASGYATSSSSSASASGYATTSSTVVSTKSIISTSVIATKSIYSNSTMTTSHISMPMGTGTAGIPTYTNGTIAISTLVPTGGESTTTGSGSTTSSSLPRPSASSPSSAGAIRVAWGMVGGAVLAAASLLL